MIIHTLGFAGVNEHRYCMIRHLFKTIAKITCTKYELDLASWSTYNRTFAALWTEPHSLSFKHHRTLRIGSSRLLLIPPLRHG
jgi:hypothetical protein